MILKNNLLIAPFLISLATITTINAASTDTQSSSSIIVLPSAPVLQGRLVAIGVGHFVKEQKIHEKLGGKKLSASEIGISITYSLLCYCEKIRNMHPCAFNAMWLRKSEIIKCVVQDPQAIKELERLGAFHQSW